MVDPALLNRVLQDLVRIESINLALVPTGSGEGAIAGYVADYFRKIGLETHLQEIGPGRLNAVGILRGQGGGTSLMLNGHLDTVGTETMAEPFSARIENGRLYGRGSLDMKGGLAAALEAARTLAQGPRLHGDLVVAAVADEEHKSLGTRALLGEFRTDAAIVMEPTGLEVVLAHKGFAWAEIITYGRAAHGSRPQEGLDAITFMGHLLVEIEGLQRKLNSQPPHPLLGHGSVHASLISGGQELSSYPARCRLSLERRLLPGENASTLTNELGEILRRLAEQNREFRAEVFAEYSASALETSRESPIVESLMASLRRIVGPSARFGVQSFWTDASLLSEAGIPSILFGPGGAGAHSSEEYVYLEDVRLSAETLAECARDFCGK
jgi:acetylornithine deacetylase